MCLLAEGYALATIYKGVVKAWVLQRLAKLDEWELAVPEGGGK